MFEEDRERLSVSKQIAQKLHVDRFNLKKLSKMEVSEQYQLNISNSSEVLESRDDDGGRGGGGGEHILGAWEKLV